MTRTTIILCFLAGLAQPSLALVWVYFRVFDSQGADKDLKNINVDDFISIADASCR